MFIGSEDPVVALDSDTSVITLPPSDDRGVRVKDFGGARGWARPPCVLAVGWSAPAVGEATLEVQQERSSESLVDFNGDGFADLALRSDDSYDTEGHGVGAVQVIYGSRSGLTAHGALDGLLRA